MIRLDYDVNGFKAFKDFEYQWEADLFAAALKDDTGKPNTPFKATGKEERPVAKVVDTESWKLVKENPAKDQVFAADEVNVGVKIGDVNINVNANSTASAVSSSSNSTVKNANGSTTSSSEASASSSSSVRVSSGTSAKISSLSGGFALAKKEGETTDAWQDRIRESLAKK